MADFSDPRAERLFEPISIGGLRLPNRIIMAPMGRLGSTDGVLGPEYVPYYRRRAEGGTGLIIGEATAIDDPLAAGYPQASHFHGKAPLAAWRKVVDAVHQAGGYFAPQLWHAGIARSPDAPNVARGARSPSGLVISQEQVPGTAPAPFDKPMSDSEIGDVVAAFVRSAQSAQTIGCDAIEIHGAHGYLLDQFLWQSTNHRRDEYGGHLGARARFSGNVVSAIKEAGVTIPVIFRFSQWKMQDYGARILKTSNDLQCLVQVLADAGVDAFHCSTRRFWVPEFENSDCSLAAWTKKFTDLPVIAVGSVGVASSFTGEDARTGGDPDWPTNLDLVLSAFDRGDFDMVALGRTLLTNPDFASSLRTGRLEQIRPYDPADAMRIF